jgi:lysophospholipase L1-like esterase
MSIRSLAVAVLAALLIPAAAAAQPAPQGPERFLSEIEAFAAADRAQAPPSCAFLFVGASSIRMWRSLAADMAPVPTINRGFGGSTVADVNFYFDKAVAPYRPRAVVFYAGENDLNAGRTPAEVVSDFHRFMDLKTHALGDTPVLFISLKPSKLRVAQMGRQAEVNAAIRAMTRTRSDLRFIDVVPPMLEGGKPKDIFIADGLHMTPDGYAIWTQVVKPAVQAEAAKPTACKAAA